MEIEYLPKIIDQWYERAAKLDQNMRESRREKEELRRNGK